TFWFHSHQNSLEQMGRGQMGILLVDYEDENKPFLKQFYSDNIWMLKDYYIDNNGKNINCTSMANSATDGTLGNQKRINGKEIGAIKAPSGSWVRIRLINGDNTRMAKINAYDENNNKVNARVLLVDGNPLRKHRKLNKDYLTPGQRLDIAIKVPSSGLVSIKDVGGEKHHTIGVIKSNGSTKQHTELLSFPVNNIPKPNLSETITKRFAFLSSADSMGKFWSINGKSMGEHSTKQDFKADDMGMGCDNNHDKVMDIIHQQMADKEMAKPLAVLEKGKSYKFRIQNGTKHSHPIHLHGHTFVVLKSSLNKNLQPYHTDIVPLEPQEIIDFAFVADNVGDWMFHCHIIEHSVTGMMGYITVK
ncbi:MAG: multicopper oxidase family protein, partial [Alphaproteobacteria bacterium]